MKTTELLVVATVILSFDKGCDTVPTRRPQQGALQRQNQGQQPQQGVALAPWYEEYPDMTAYQNVPPYLPVHPVVLYDESIYYPPPMDLQDPYYYMGLGGYGPCRSGQKKHGRKHKPRQ
ncbi:uncharacterized protein LOC126480960 [Schistocerca serialis cubense]|uniref:uncharacterized protein LOC126480960 n=1 Tax=Schistocerca serialis cubense TaxID=2023355 RepID=UPI00214F21A6|nr:uncharacterized protein LOC126480960 [Schistocerca serialis cubense]